MTKTELTAELERLRQVSLSVPAPAVHVILHKLVAALNDGKANDLAKHVCAFGGGLTMSAGIAGSRELLPGEKPEDVYPSGPDFIC